MNAAPYSNPTTSRDAARSVEPELGRLEASVLASIGRKFGLCHFLPIGSTCEDIETELSLTHQCASARIRGLVLKGKIEDSGETRPTRSGRNAIVWRVVTTAPRQMDFPAI